MKLRVLIFTLFILVISILAIYLKGNSKMRNKTMDPFFPFTRETSVASKEKQNLIDSHDLISNYKKKPISKEMIHAFEYGAKAQLSVCVTDSKGQPVENAEVIAEFSATRNPSETLKALTDATGNVLLTAEKAGQIVKFYVLKNGYYKTRLQYLLEKKGQNCAQNGRWVPWPHKINISLKEIRKPRPLFVNEVKIFFPKKEIGFGFDCMVGDLVEPFGKGKNADLLFKYFSDMQGWRKYCFTNQLVISAGGQLAGVITKKPDIWSAFITSYEAPLEEYGPEFILGTSAAGPKNIIGKMDYENEFYIVFRSRVVTNKNGEIKAANYGVIYPEFHFGDAPPEKGEGRVKFRYYFNPTPNDRNLEFDGTNNLFRPGWKDSKWPREP